MPSRRDMLAAPENRFERAAWLDEHFETHLKHVPLGPGGWAGVARLEAAVFPSMASEFLGGELDPTCPACGIETDEGTVERIGELFRVTYRTCGCVYDITEAQLLQRVRHARNA